MNNKNLESNFNFDGLTPLKVTAPRLRKSDWMGILAGVLMVGLVGCGNIIPRGQSPDEALITMDDDSKKTIYIGDVCKVWGLNYEPVEGVGLVSSLDGTGSNPVPSGQRDHLLTELKSKGKVADPKKAIASQNTSMVLLKGLLPPGIKKGERFDVEVKLMPKSDTHSLQYGKLMNTRMRPMMNTGRTVKLGNVNALAEGSVMVDSVFESRQDEPNQTRGWIFDTPTAKFIKNPGLAVKNGRFIKYSAAERANKVIEWTDDDYILPGLVDCHAHYNVKLIRKRREEFSVIPVQYLANGVTVTFSCGEFRPEEMQDLRKRIDAGQQVGPRLINSGPYFGRARPGWRGIRPADEIRQEVDFWAKQGVGGFKAKAISPSELQPLIEQAHQHGLTVTGHLGSGYRNSVNPRDAIVMGIDRIEHFLGGDAMPATDSAYHSFASASVLGPSWPLTLSSNSPAWCSEPRVITWRTWRVRRISCRGFPRTTNKSADLPISIDP